MSVKRRQLLPLSFSTDSKHATPSKQPITVQSNENHSYPRAAVAVTIRYTNPNNQYFLLIQRKNPPDQGYWSLPGGKMQWGESTMDAAKRELAEEINFVMDEKSSSSILHQTWLEKPFTTTDAISRSYINKDSNEAAVVVDFHYLIAHCFVEVMSSPPARHPQRRNNSVLPKIIATDDAKNAAWWTLDELREKVKDSIQLSNGVLDVLEQAKQL